MIYKSLWHRNFQSDIRLWYWCYSQGSSKSCLENRKEKLNQTEWLFKFLPIFLHRNLRSFWSVTPKQNCKTQRTWETKTEKSPSVQVNDLYQWTIFANEKLYNCNKWTDTWNKMARRFAMTCLNQQLNRISLTL